MLVMKFGGTSVKNAEAMSQALKIVQNRKIYSPVVVLSACSGVTDKLLELVNKAAFVSFEESLKTISDIEDLHFKIIQDFIKAPSLKVEALDKIKNLCNELRELIKGISLLRETTPRRIDAVLAFGELLSTNIFQSGCVDNKIDSVFLDARKFMKTDDNFNKANVDFSLVQKAAEWFILPELEKGKVVITQGFIGSDLSDITTTLGRGGSDYSAAVIGLVLNSDEIQIWTDVSGVLSADPKIITDTRTVTEMTFDEVLELSFYGAKVLHPDTIKPAIEKNIPVKVLNTFEPENSGTIILAHPKKNETVFHSVVLKEDCLMCYIDSVNNNGFSISYSNIVNKLSEQNISSLFSTDISHRLSFIFDDTKDSNEEYLKHLLSEYNPSFKKISLICICGNNLDKPGESKNLHFDKLFGIISRHSTQGYIFGLTPSSILILVPVNEGKKVLKELHKLL